MKQLDQIMPQYKDGDYYADLWKSVSRDLVAHYGEDLYKSWFSKISFFEAIGESEIILSAPSNFIRDWIKSNYGRSNIGQKSFWIDLGLDQMAHQLTYLGIAYLVS